MTELITRRFLVNASLIYKDICPEQSRFLMRRRLRGAATMPESVICPFCYQWRQPDNHRVRLRPKRKPTARIRRLLKREMMGKRLNTEQNAVLQKFKRACNALMATCHTCNKMSRQPGMNRELLCSLSESRGTPWSARKHKTPQKTPQSANRATPKSAFSDKTPSGTPRSVSSNASSSSSKSGSAKSSPFARLKKILMLEDKQQSRKGGLKDFLSSL